MKLSIMKLSMFTTIMMMVTTNAWFPLHYYSYYESDVKKTYRKVRNLTFRSLVYMCKVIHLFSIENEAIKSILNRQWSEGGDDEWGTWGWEESGFHFHVNCSKILYPWSMQGIKVHHPYTLCSCLIKDEAISHILCILFLPCKTCCSFKMVMIMME